MGRRQKVSTKKERMDTSDPGCVVYSDTSTGDPLTVTLASDYDKSQEKTQVNWTMAATQLFIASWVTRKELFRKMPSREVYSVISSDLQEMGYNYSGEQCSIKWRSLKASFLKSKATMYHRDKPSNWVHFQAMAEALDEQDTSNGPGRPKREKIQEQYEDDDDQHSDGNDVDSSHNSPPSSPPPTHPPSENKIVVRRGRPPKRLQRLQPTKKVLRTASVKTGLKTSELVKYLGEMQEEWKIRREERQRMHEERMELGRKKLGLMEHLISILKTK